MPLTPLYVGDILRWADEFHERRGRWPDRDDGPVDGTTDLTWRRIDSALKLGNRGLRRGSSLAKLLLANRQRRHKGLPPATTEGRILEWADAHRTRTGDWPSHTSGKIPEARGETWSAIDRSLRFGRRELPGGSSLAQLLEARRGVRNVQAAPDLTEEQILGWADDYRAAAGSWPTRDSGPVAAAPGETWSAVAQALIVGGRGLRRPTSLARLLERRRGARNHMNLPPLSEGQVLAWADAHHGQTGKWPTRVSGEVSAAPGEAWSAIDVALVAGVRGLPGGDSLARLLSRHRGARNKQALPPLSLVEIRKWVEAHRRRTGRPPRHTDGPIPEAPGETWGGVHSALAKGWRGLPGGSSLYRLSSERAVTEFQGA